MMAVTGFLRTLVADTPYSSFGALSMGYLLVAGTILAIIKCILRERFRMAWWVKTGEEAGVTQHAGFTDSV